MCGAVLRGGVGGASRGEGEGKEGSNGVGLWVAGHGDVGREVEKPAGGGGRGRGTGEEEAAGGLRGGGEVACWH